MGNICHKYSAFLKRCLLWKRHFLKLIFLPFVSKHFRSLSSKLRFPQTTPRRLSIIIGRDTTIKKLSSLLNKQVSAIRQTALKEPIWDGDKNPESKINPF